MVNPTQISLKIWPPVGTINTVKTEDLVVCVIVKRQTKNDYLGKLAYEAGDYQKAVSLLKNATYVDPANEIAWINLGKAYTKLDKPNKAEKAFKQCLKVIPNYEPSNYYLAQIAFEARDWERAESYYKSIIESNPKSYQTYLAYAKLMNAKNEAIEALCLLNECLKYNSGYEPAIILRQEILEKINKY